MSPKRFKRAFRLSKSTVGSLCKCVEKRIESDSNPQVRIPIEVGIAMTLRYLAGGSYIDIALAYFVSVSTFYFVTEEAIRVIDNCLSLQFPHTDPDRLRLISEGFARGKSPLSGCAGALDGISIRIREPSANEVANPVTYFNRKGMFALCVQAVWDSNYRFTFASALCPGSTQDSVAFAASSFSTFLQKVLEVGVW
jgi:hypothetical protein